jgi:hypothetical protein
LSDICADAESVGYGRTLDATEISEPLGKMVRLISPEDEVPIERRLEQLGLRALAEIITEPHTQINIQQRRIALLTSQVANQQMVLERLQSNVGGLMASAQLQPHLIGGPLPNLPEITQLKVQIFHSPDLLPKDRRAKTEWSLRLTVWVNGLRAAEEIKGVQLFNCKQFADKVAALIGDVPGLTRTIAERFVSKHSDEALIGTLRAKTKGKGTPYIRDQFCVLHGHWTDTPTVMVSICGEYIEVSHLRPGAGTKAGHAKWWGEWSR